MNAQPGRAVVKRAGGIIDEKTQMLASGALGGVAGAIIAQPMDFKWQAAKLNTTMGMPATYTVSSANVSNKYNAADVVTRKLG